MPAATATSACLSTKSHHGAPQPHTTTSRHFCRKQKKTLKAVQQLSGVNEGIAPNPPGTCKLHHSCKPRQRHLSAASMANRHQLPRLPQRLAFSDTEYVALLAHHSSGKGPDSWLPSKCTPVRFERDPRNAGRVPVNWLPASASHCSFIKVESSKGTRPLQARAEGGGAGGLGGYMQ